VEPVASERRGSTENIVVVSRKEERADMRVGLHHLLARSDLINNMYLVSGSASKNTQQMPTECSLRIDTSTPLFTVTSNDIQQSRPCSLSSPKGNREYICLSEAAVILWSTALVGSTVLVWQLPGIVSSTTARVNYRERQAVIGTNTRGMFFGVLPRDIDGITHADCHDIADGRDTMFPPYVRA
jgi:hypothetical protein